MFYHPTVQSFRTVEELREAMDEEELKTFLTIHIREGAWQVAMLFLDELPRSQLSLLSLDDALEDEEIAISLCYSSRSGILTWWPPLDDCDLATLCKAITDSDRKISRLILSWSLITDEGVKNLSEAITHSELNSLTLLGSHIKDQGLKHLSDTLTSSACKLTSLKVRSNRIGDEGIKHLCKALTSRNCKLTSLNVSDNYLGDEGIKHLCKALTSTDCKLSCLDLRGNRGITDKGEKYLSEALTGSDWEVKGLQLFRSVQSDT